MRYLFCHRQKQSEDLFLARQSRGINIESNSTVQKKFTQCSNSKCKAIFQYESVEKLIETNFLCDKCIEKISTHHIVQCKNCQSLVNFLPVYEGEEPIVFYVKKCHHCSGSYEDERRIQPLNFNEIFI